jgi:hypothetical protein
VREARNNGRKLPMKLINILVPPKGKANNAGNVG